MLTRAPEIWMGLEWWIDLGAPQDLSDDNQNLARVSPRISGLPGMSYNSVTR